MEDITIIESFLQIVEDIESLWEPKTVADLSELDEKLCKLQNQPITLAANAIIEWCKEHPKVRGKIIFKSRELQAANSGESVNIEPSLNNYYPRIKEAIKKLQNTSNISADNNSGNRTKNYLG